MTIGGSDVAIAFSADGGLKARIINPFIFNLVVAIAFSADGGLKEMCADIAVTSLAVAIAFSADGGLKDYANRGSLRSV